MYTCITDVPSLANINHNWFGQLLDAEGRVGIAEQVALFALEQVLYGFNKIGALVGLECNIRRLVVGESGEDIGLLGIGSFLCALFLLCTNQPRNII